MVPRNNKNESWFAGRSVRPSARPSVRPSVRAYFSFTSQHDSRPIFRIVFSCLLMIPGGLTLGRQRVPKKRTPRRRAACWRTPSTSWWSTVRVVTILIFDYEQLQPMHTYFSVVDRAIPNGSSERTDRSVYTERETNVICS